MMPVTPDYLPWYLVVDTKYMVEDLPELCDNSHWMAEWGTHLHSILPRLS